MNKKKIRKVKKKSSSKPQNLNKQKGELLERVIAALYKSPGVIIEKNVNYPTTDGEDTREIDILLKTSIAGLSVEFAFQCKNEAKPLDVNKMGEFVAALQDIGVPTQYGIFVSINGFTKGAIRLAKKNGIKTLILKGLTKDRIKNEISEAIQHTIFLIPRIDKFTVTNKVSKGEYEWQFFLFFDENEKPVGSFIDLIFNKWRNNEIPETLGSHKIELEVPINWNQYYKGKKIKPLKITAEVSILATVIEIKGEAQNHLLLDAETKNLEQYNLDVNFKVLETGKEIPSHNFYTEKDLENFLSKSKKHRISIRTKLPRLISNYTYYPYSKSVANKMFSLIEKHSPNFKDFSQEKFNQIMFEASKNDMFSEGICNIWGKEVSVIVTDNNGDLVDVTLLAEQGECEKIITLKDKYLKNPSKHFREILAWAFEEKSNQLFEKIPKVKKEKTNILLKESLVNIQKSLQLYPESLSAIERLARTYYGQEDYPSALKILESLIPKTKAKNNLYLLKLQIYLKQKDWNKALKVLEKLERIIKKDEIKEAEPMLLFYRSEILSRQKRYNLAWRKLLKAWQESPEEIVDYSSSSEFVDKLINEVPTVEGRLFYIEVLYYRATQHLKFNEFTFANETVDFAFENLKGFKLLSQIEGEPVTTGNIKDSVIEDILKRICKLLNDTEESKFAKQHIERIKDWFKQTFSKDIEFTLEM